MRRIACFLFAISILIGGAVNSAALTNGYRIEEISINTSTGNVNCYAELTVCNGASGKVTCSLQKNTGANWVTLATWTGSGSTVAAINETWHVDAGYTYRMSVTYYIYDANGNLLEQASYAASKHYPRDFEYNAFAEECIS